jgi:glutathione-independent formaldehyde dehydrogenase
MDAVVVTGPGELVVRQVPEPTIEKPTDVLLRLTSSAICGSDLHIYQQRLGAFIDQVIGHEPLGVVQAVGADVLSVRNGDRVVVPTHICCGFCGNCRDGNSAACLTVNPGKAGGAYGYPKMGGYQGAQTRLLRVPLADANCLKLPGEPNDEFEDDFVMLADAFPTGYHATELAHVGLGDSVVIYGAGAVGLSAVMSSFVRGAAVVYAVDYVPERLAKAGAFGAVPVDFRAGDPIEQIKRMQSKRRDSAAHRDEKVMGGVTCGIDAIGFQARDYKDLTRENPRQVIQDLAKLVNPGGHIGIIGVFPESDPKGPDPMLQGGDIPVPWGPLFSKGISIGMGRDPDERYNRHLRDLIWAKKVRPGRIVSHRLSIADAVDAYGKFDRRTDGYIKVVLRPG